VDFSIIALKGGKCGNVALSDKRIVFKFK